MDAEFAGYLDPWIGGEDQARWRPVRPDPDVPELDAATRAAGIQVAIQCSLLYGEMAVLSVEGQEEPVKVLAQPIASALGVTIPDLPGLLFFATLRETPETGQQLSAYRLMRPRPR
jgi:hypothetical protein